MERCINSIPRRDDIQIVVVDDCSPNQESFLNVINRIKKERSVEIYSTHKGGSAGCARNIGIEHALGRWLIFADADDFFDDSFEMIIDNHKDSESDVVYFNYRSVMSDNPSIASDRKDKRDRFAEYDETCNDSYFRYEFHVPWAKMIKRSLVKNHRIRFDETRYANDAMFATLVGCYADEIECDSSIGYVLTEREDSLCGNMFNKPGEMLIRTKVLLRVNNLLKVLGHNYDTNYDVFLKNLIRAKDIKGLKEIYSDAEKYGLSRREIREIVRHTGLRYYPLSIWLKFFG